ncbi:MAG: A/G-specific adenine glycosylase [Gammaproteobacteria bacterium]|nr:A/G-specific adenine glycosylase [Gammaproteobacteria bacterium]
MDWFAHRVLQWFDSHGRKDLPWQHPIDPYRVWVSEIMLQQTQVSTVIPYFQRFMARFPDVASLAAAELDDVLHLWTGLGYYARGRNLHRTARLIAAEHGGRFPDDPAALAGLPGIGPSTAGAIAAIAFGRPAAILDGNVKRVLARFHAVDGYPGDSGPLKVLWQHAQAHTPAERPGDYAQAMMDLGATVCTRSRPQCAACPVAARCAAHRRGATDRYPVRKARADKPLRAARLFLVIDPHGRCLLEHRPPTGVWGGLWTPPQRNSDATLADLCGEFDIPAGDVAESRSGTAFRHTFTHFHLDLEPVYVHLRRAPGHVADRADICWYDAAEPPNLGLSAPAARLLKDIIRDTPH